MQGSTLNFNAHAQNSGPRSCGNAPVVLFANEIKHGVDIYADADAIIFFLINWFEFPVSK